MRIIVNHRFSAIALVCLLVLSGAVGYAQKYNANFVGAARPQINIILSGAVERAGAKISVEDAGRVNSGELLSWNIVSANSGAAPALTHDAVGQIPAGTTFVEGSAAAESSAAVAYSIDHGKTLSPQPLIAVRQPDGSIKQSPAPVSMYTQIRFRWNTPLAVSDERAASYKVRVR